jgi:hypothetical protein
MTFQEIKPSLEELSQVDVQSLKREGRDYDFSSIYPLISETFKNLDLLKENPDFWDILPVDRAGAIKSQIDQFRQSVGQVEATNDPKIKDAVLIQATKAIFEAGETGYISSKDGSSTGIETIKIFDQIKDR